MAETATKRRTKPTKPETAPTETAPIEGIPKQITFFQRIEAIPLADWGTRARVRVYRLEPLIDAMRSSGKKYITIYDDGPPTEERIKIDHGSGRYRLYLNMKTAGQATERELDMIEIDILDPKFPPRLELGDWVDDPKNRKWNWAKKILEDQASKTAAAQPAAPQSPNVLIDAMHVIGEVQKNAFEQARANTPAAPVDPAVNAFTMAKEMLQITKGGGDSTLLEMFRDELKAAREENSALQADFRKLMTTPPPPVPTPADPLDSFAASLEKFEKIKNVLAPKQSDSVISPNMRSKMSGWQEFAVNIAEKAFESPVIGNLLGLFAQGMFNRAQAPNGTAAPIPQQLTSAGVMPNPAAPPNQMQQVIDFLNTIATPMLNMFGDDMDGGDFAEWLYEGHGDTWIHPSGQSVQWYVGAKQIGAPNLLQFFQRSPYWAKLQPQAEKFTKFLTEFVAWEIPKEPEADAVPEVVDFDGNAIGANE